MIFLQVLFSFYHFQFHYFVLLLGIVFLKWVRSNQLLSFYICNHCIKHNQETTQTGQTIYQAYSQATYYMSLLAIKKSYMRNCLGLRADPLYPFLSWWFIILLKLVVEPLHLLVCFGIQWQIVYCFARKNEKWAGVEMIPMALRHLCPRRRKAKYQNGHFDITLFPGSLFLSNKSWRSV